MTANHHKPEVIQRGARMLRTALGPTIARFLEDPAVVEVMLNPDGRDSGVRALVRRYFR